MSVNSNLFIHELDRSALQALKTIPGFTQLLKAYMKVWSEQQFRIQNMATNLRISEKQMSKYYKMLIPICEKLGIEVPELYLTLDVNPNAYTSGDTKPFIVMTSGLLETLPEELIPSVLAHECGHIACHHVLYSTMGRMILNGTTSLLGLSDLVSFPLQAAFYYWMRCSELSADRAAAVCDGSADKVIETCMRFAGYDKDIEEKANVDAFMEQALEYKNMMADSKWNKTLEFLMFSHIDHPLNAVRAYECNEWQKKDSFANIVAYINSENGEGSGGEICSLPIIESSKFYNGKPYHEVQQNFMDTGFVNVEMERLTDKAKSMKEGTVIAVKNEQDEEVKMGEWYSAIDKIKIVYYEPWSEEEIIAMHPGEARMPESAKKYTGKNYLQVVQELEEAGFSDIVISEIQDLKKGWVVKEGSIAKITVNDNAQFEKGDWYALSANICIEYHSLMPTEESK